MSVEIFFIKMSKKNTLTPRQVQIMCLCANGVTDKSIADILGISVNTVSNHFCKILSRLKAKSRTHAVWIVKKQLTGR